MFGLERSVITVFAKESVGSLVSDHGKTRAFAPAVNDSLTGRYRGVSLRNRPLDVEIARWN